VYFNFYLSTIYCTLSLFARCYVIFGSDLPENILNTHPKNNIKRLLKNYYKNYIINNSKQIEKECNKTLIYQPCHKSIHTKNTPYHTCYWNSNTINKTLYQHNKHPHYFTKYTNTKIHPLLKLLITNKNRLTKYYKIHRKKPKSTHY